MTRGAKFARFQTQGWSRSDACIVFMQDFPGEIKRSVNVGIRIKNDVYSVSFGYTVGRYPFTAQLPVHCGPVYGPVYVAMYSVP